MADERRMSCYGAKEFSPEEIKEQWREFMRREIFTKNRYSFYKPKGPCKFANISDFSRHLTYFNNNKKNDSESTYDRLFHIHHGYCSRIHRDDREHTQGLDVHAEEQNKAVPMLSSSVYGHRPPIDVPSRKHVRVGLVKRDFYRPSGSVLPSGERKIGIQATASTD